MDVIFSPEAEIGIRTLLVDDRRRVQSWCDHLKNWENDQFVRDRAQKLSTDDAVFVLRTSTDIRLFFTFQKDRIVILDIAREAALQSFGTASA